MKSHPVKIKIDEFASIIKSRSSLTPTSVLDIGSFDGADGIFLANEFGILDNKTYLFEAHPGLYNKIISHLKEAQICPNVIHRAISDRDGKVSFHAIDLSETNTQISSLISRPSAGRKFNEVSVMASRIDTLFKDQPGFEMDIVKIDVEGLAYNVLRGFGGRIGHVKAIHIESEHRPVWKGQVLFPEIEKFLIGHGFVLTEHRLIFPQSDSIWIKDKYYKYNWWK